MMQQAPEWLRNGFIVFALVGAAVCVNDVRLMAAPRPTGYTLRSIKARLTRPLSWPKAPDYVDEDFHEYFLHSRFGNRDGRLYG